MIRKIGRKSWAFIALIGITVARFLFQQLGENIFGSVYTEYIEPSITRKIYVITKSREELENDGFFNIVEEYAFSVDLILLFEIVSIIILCIALLARKIYLQKNIKRNAQEECILQAMKALVYDTEYILAAQLYRYRIDTFRRGRSRNKKIVIDHIGSNYNDGMDINAIVHEEFMLEGKHYKNVTLFLSRYNEFEKTNSNEDYQKAAKGISHTIETFKKEFASLSLDKIEENIAFTMRFIRAYNVHWGRRNGMILSMVAMMMYVSRYATARGRDVCQPSFCNQCIPSEMANHLLSKTDYIGLLLGMKICYLLAIKKLLLSLHFLMIRFNNAMRG